MSDGASFAILLVEDNDDDIAIATRAVGKSGVPARLIVARDGQEALDLLLGRARYGRAAIGTGCGLT